MELRTSRGSVFGGYTLDKAQGQRQAPKVWTWSEKFDPPIVCCRCLLRANCLLDLLILHYNERIGDVSVA